MWCLVGKNCRLLSSSAPGVHHGDDWSIGADLLDDAVENAAVRLNALGTILSDTMEYM